MSWVIYTSFAWPAVIDLVIAIAMCYYLFRSKSGFSGTNSKIIMIIRMILISGFLTSACSLTALICYATMPNTLVFLGIEFLLTKLYINSFLAMLNARQTVQDKDSTGQTLSGTKILNIRTATSMQIATGHSGELASPYDLEEGKWQHPTHIQKGAIPLSPLSPYRNDSKYIGQGYGNQDPHIIHQGPLVLRSLVEEMSRLEMFNPYSKIGVGAYNSVFVCHNIPPSQMPQSALEALQQSGIVIASDTGEYLQIGEFFPQDATTNPSLVFAAISKPPYAHLTDEALHYATSRPGSLEAQTELACDYLLVQVGIQILNIIPGRVSVSVDPRLANDTDAIVAKGRKLISVFEEFGYPRERVLIKIPATYSGILAARTLETSPKPIHTNATLIFGVVQALACAQARITVISPFIGRVKDWWAARYAQLHNGETQPALPLSQHPGILLVRDIRSAFSEYGHTTTVMAAGFRVVDEVVEVGKYGQKGGPDILTLQPELLDGLRKRPGVAHSTDMPKNKTGSLPEPRYIDREGDARSDAQALFVEDLAREGIAVEKVPEGLAKFSVDAKNLEDLLRSKIRAALDSAPRS
ncbi:hypothetical protein DXG01_014103 [Tephrocybe rancida]|nr:hypothetical protein DXG01_014103 [Tephrocybe rancida]